MRGTCAPVRISGECYKEGQWVQKKTSASIPIDGRLGRRRIISSPWA
jgi:hypothetical protein